MANNLVNLNDILFDQLKRLNDPNLRGSSLIDEIERSRAVANVSSQIISTANTALKAAKFKDEAMDANARVPKMFAGGGE